MLVIVVVSILLMPGNHLLVHFGCTKIDHEHD